jgi:OOP family OmpA-OmpF porin
MNNRQILALTAMIALTPLFANAAAGQTLAGPYIGLAAGSDMPSDSDLDIDVNLGSFHSTNHVTSKWANGWGISAVGGYKWDFGLRTEAEFSFRSQGIKAFNTSPWNGTQWDNSLMVNALYDIPTGTRFTPYIGGGIGGTHLEWLNNFRPAGTSVIYDAGDLQFGWQGIVGLAYAVTPQIEATLDFRIKGATGFRFPANVAGIVARNFDYQTQSLFLGVRYAFGG